MSKREVSFEVEGGVVLRAGLYIPEGSGPHPAITMAHGYAGTREHGLERFAKLFASEGFVVLLHDHRNFGTSDGQPRHDIDPWQQIADWRRAISYLESLPEVDSLRIGLWGTSYAGGHALVLGATDGRLKAIVSQVPTISGYEQMLRRVAPDMMAKVESNFDQDERAQLAGKPPAMQAVVSSDLSIPAVYRSPDAIAFYNQKIPDGLWKNEVTVRSGRRAKMYEPGNWISRISPTPLLMVVASHDVLTLTDLELAAYERALEPKKLVMIPGNHFSPYLEQFDTTGPEAAAWFKKYLS
jgi:fermentation-respiration switch protein FrsA (DUF1100 family)